MILEVKINEHGGKWTMRYDLSMWIVQKRLFRDAVHIVKCKWLCMIR